MGPGRQVQGTPQPSGPMQRPLGAQSALVLHSRVPASGPQVLSQATVPSGLHAQTVQESTRQRWPNSQRAPLGSAQVGGGGGGPSQGPRNMYGREGQVELPVKVTPSQPQKGARSSVHGRPRAGPQTQGTPQP